jgi:hypothetical protein
MNYSEKSVYSGPDIVDFTKRLKEWSVILILKARIIH